MKLEEIQIRETSVNDFADIMEVVPDGSPASEEQL